MNLAFFSKWVLAGVIATMVMDLSGFITRALHVTIGVPPPLTVKWIKGVLAGRVFVDDIRSSAGEPGTMPTFLAFHYVIGISFALMLGVGAKLLDQPVSWQLALGFGVCTTLVPALLMFPGMGFGVLGLQGPPEWRLLMTSLINHLFFGVGLAVAACYLFPQ